MTDRSVVVPRDGGARLVIRLTPRGGRNRIDGLVRLADGQEALAVRVSAPPENGKANAALIEIVAHYLGIPVRDLVLVAGATSRLKTVQINSPYEKVIERIRLLP